MDAEHPRTNAGADENAAREETLGGRDADVTEASDARPAGADDPEALRDEVAAMRTKWLRALADLENYRKRVEKERGRWSAEAREEVLMSLLEVADDFERAIAFGDETGVPPDDPFRAGVELILERLREILRKYDVTPIETRGAGFDPSLHEAVAHVDSDTHGTDQIVEEVRKGYMMGDRLLRCSRVVVAK